MLSSRLCSGLPSTRDGSLRTFEANFSGVRKKSSSASEILRYDIVRETDVSMVQKYIYLMGCPRVRLKPEKQTRRGLSGLP